MAVDNDGASTVPGRAVSHAGALTQSDLARGAKTRYQRADGLDFSDETDVYCPLVCGAAVLTKARDQ